MHNQVFYNNEMDKKKIKRKQINTNDKDKYIKLMNDFYDFNLTTNDFINENFNDVINDFQNDLKESGYDGNSDLNNMHWFIKGLK